MSMVGAVTPYLQWMRSAAAQCEEAATRATPPRPRTKGLRDDVPPPAIPANRVRLAMLILPTCSGRTRL